uniref:Uncharacterized protein n=1 Tax=Anguilla anguilla TaxID=7936 RepID=A0A0E9R1A6_ANGAN
MAIFCSFSKWTERHYCLYAICTCILPLPGGDVKWETVSLITVQ